MTEKAASLVAGAKQWATLYGDYPNGEEGAVLTAALRARAAWDAGDAGTFARMFVDNGSMLIGDTQLKNSEEIRTYLSEAFAAGWKGTRLDEQPREIRLLTPTVAIAIMEGGLVPPGGAAVDPAAAERAMWVLAKQDGDWRVVSRQTCPIRN